MWPEEISLENLRCSEEEGILACWRQGQREQAHEHTCESPDSLTLTLHSIPSNLLWSDCFLSRLPLFVACLLLVCFRSHSECIMYLLRFTPPLWVGFRSVTRIKRHLQLDGRKQQLYQSLNYNILKMYLCFISCVWVF